MKIKTLDVWTEPVENYMPCFNGAFLDGVEGNNVPYDKYKIILNCNCFITTNSNELTIGNKHNAIIFYKNNRAIRLVVLSNKTEVLRCVEKTINKKVNNNKLKDLFLLKNINQEIIDLKEVPVFNKSNNLKEIDVWSCDRASLLESIFEEDCKSHDVQSVLSIYDFKTDIEVVYELETNTESYEILHKGAYINKSKTKAIIIQSNGSF